MSPRLSESYGKLPLSFESNQGQVDPQVRFLSHGNGYSLFLTDSAAVLSITKQDARSKKVGSKTFIAKPSSPAKPGKTDVVRMELVGAAPGLGVEGDDKLPGKANYFIGNDRSQWHRDVSTYAKVKYSGVYPGVDLVYYGSQRQLEYDFILAPKADSKPVKLHFAGAEKLKLNHDGDLAVIAKNGQIIFHKPAIYQTKDGQREPVEGRFSLMAKNTVGFNLGAYDHTRELVIDPTFTLAYATYLAGPNSGGDSANATAVDQQGNAYITGQAASYDFPITSGAFQTVNPTHFNCCGAAFVTKLNPAGSALIYSTYVGGSGQEIGEYGDSATGIAIDNEGYAYITGTTASTDFPVTPGAFQTSSSGFPVTPDSNSFVTKLNLDGSGLIYSTYLSGSTSINVANAIAVDSVGHAFVAGFAGSANFPVTPGAFQPYRTAPSGFVTEFSSDGSSLVYSTFLGGSDSRSTSISAIAVDALDQAYVTGETSSPKFPVTPGAFQTIYKAAEQSSTVFVTKLNSAGTAPIYSSYLGGSNGEAGVGIAVDGQGNAYVTGITYSNDFPVTSGAYQVTTMGQNGFVTKLNPAGSAQVYSTYFGVAASFYYSYNEPPKTISTSAIALDASGHAYVSGAPWLRVLNTAGTGLIYTSSINGSLPQSVAVDGSGNAYLAGISAMQTVPTTSGAFQPTNLSNSRELPFVARFNLNDATTTSLTSSDNPQNSGAGVTFTAHVVPVNGSGVPTGIVSFSYPGMAPQHVTLDGSGNASYTTSGLPVGTIPIKALYLATEQYPASVASLSQTITGQLAAPHFVTPGGTFSAPFFVAIDTAIPGPTIYYTTDGTTPGTSSTKYTGLISVTAPTTTIKAIAVQSGDTSSPVATATYTIAPAAIATTTSMQSSLNPSVEGQPVTFTATVTAASGPAPTGSVTFKHGSTVLGSVPLTGGVATFTTSDLAPNYYNFAAVYTGSATDANSHSATLAQQVNAP